MNFSIVNEFNLHISNLLNTESIDVDEKFLFQYRQLLSYMLIFNYLSIKDFKTHEINFTLNIPLFAIKEHKVNLFIIFENSPIHTLIETLDDKVVLKLVEAVLCLFYSL